MSERVATGSGRAGVCPFVALEDSRDARLQVPDHRHRCFAENPPAPRALAHQAAYCLAPSFAGCPTFTDWALREAAPVKDARPGTERREGAPAPATRDAIDDGDRNRRPAFIPIQPEREPMQRGWADPPPWAPPARSTPPVAGSGRAFGDAAFDDAADENDDLANERGALPADWEVSPGPPMIATGPGRAAPDPGPADRRPPEAGLPPPGAGPLPPLGLPSPLAAEVPAAEVPAAEVPEFLARDRSAPPAPRPGDRSAIGRAPTGRSAGWRGDAADEAGRPRRPLDDGQAAPLPERLPAVPPDEPGPHPPPPVRPAGRPAAEPAVRPPTGPERHVPVGYARIPDPNRVARARPAAPRDPAAPAWERPRTLEDYGSLRARSSGVPPFVRLLVIVGILVVAVFTLPFLLRAMTTGGTPAAASPSASAAASARPTPSGSPTPVPAPTPLVYVVKAGDSLSKIAQKFGLSVAQVMAANPKIKNPDKIKLGDEIIIPTPAPSEVVDQSSPSATP